MHSLRIVHVWNALYNRKKKKTQKRSVLNEKSQLRNKNGHNESWYINIIEVINTMWIKFIFVVWSNVVTYEKFNENWIKLPHFNWPSITVERLIKIINTPPIKRIAQILEKRKSSYVSRIFSRQLKG